MFFMNTFPGEEFACGPWWPEDPPEAYDIWYGLDNVYDAYAYDTDDRFDEELDYMNPSVISSEDFSLVF